MDNIFDSPRQECRASSPFGALLAEPVLFLRLASLDVLRFVPGLMMQWLWGCLKKSQEIVIASFVRAFGAGRGHPIAESWTLQPKRRFKLDVGPSVNNCGTRHPLVNVWFQFV